MITVNIFEGNKKSWKNVDIGRNTNHYEVYGTCLGKNTLVQTFYKVSHNKDHFQVHVLYIVLDKNAYTPLMKACD